MMQQHEIIIDFKARFHTLGTLTPGTKQIWFVLHGYGQLSTYFIRKFSVLQAHNIYIVAPEGLSRFYLENIQHAGRANDRVGATWMTKENRETDIENYLNYLNVLYKHQTEKYDSVPVTVLGFSQGAATASRWVASRQVTQIKRLILWSGVFPPDLHLESSRQIFKSIETYFVYGKSDPFVNDNRFTEMKVISEKLGIEPHFISFDGKHEIEEQTLMRFI